MKILIKSSSEWMHVVIKHMYIFFPSESGSDLCMFVSDIGKS
jgi:hypothetical protein